MVVLVDDGMATGLTVKAASGALRKLGATRVSLAVPVASPQAREFVAGEVDEVFCLYTPDDFKSVGLAYKNFDPVSDEEIVEILDRSKEFYAREKAPRARVE